MTLSPRERVMRALRGEHVDKVPCTVYDSKVPQCTEERCLRNRGLCLVSRITSYKVRTPNVKVEEVHYTDEAGRALVRAVYGTPYGEVSTLVEPAGFTSWRHEYLFKSKEDYRAILFLINDSVIEPDYANAARLVEKLGDDFVVRDNFSLEPMQSLISSSYMSMETFCMEWMDNQDEVLKLYEAFVEVARKMYPIVAEGPLEFANYGGNVVPQLIGAEMFRQYYIPHYNEAAEVLHKHGKLIGCHLDADNTPIMDDVAQTLLDYIEAYDPGMSPSVAEAIGKWPDKALWINWPSASHLSTPENVKSKTVELINEAAGSNRFIIGITEDVPEDRWKANFAAIMDGIDEAAG